MDRLIYTALTAMQRGTERQAVTAHNLANVETPGFRREMTAMQQGYLVSPPRGAALSTRVQAGGETSHDLMREGRVVETGRGTDVAMMGGAWLAVADAGGAEAYTRRGDLRFDSEGRLLTGAGQQVLGIDGAPIILAGNPAQMRIGMDGAIEMRATDEEPFVEVARMKLVSPPPDALSRGADGLFRTDAPLAADPLARVMPGAMESSNVEAAAVLVELIEQSRGFEIQTKLLSAAREMDENGARLMRIDG
ncbi:MAG: flagellar basal body rod protein FlgF [Sphingomonadaceae bacterium]